LKIGLSLLNFLRPFMKFGLSKIILKII